MSAIAPLPSTRPPRFKADYAGRDLRGFDFSHADLTGDCLVSADLSGADLSGANLAGADLTGADLTAAKVTGASFHGATGMVALFPAKGVICGGTIGGVPAFLVEGLERSPTVYCGSEAFAVEALYPLTPETLNRPVFAADPTAAWMTLHAIAVHAIGRGWLPELAELTRFDHPAVEIPCRPVGTQIDQQLAEVEAYLGMANFKLRTGNPCLARPFFEKAHSAARNAAATVGIKSHPPFAYSVRSTALSAEKAESAIRTGRRVAAMQGTKRSPKSLLGTLITQLETLLGA